MNQNNVKAKDEQAPIILLVDDEYNLRVLLGRQLRHVGYQVVEAENGVKALDWINRREHFDLLITDIMMPEMNGIELVEKVRESRKTIPVIFISGYMDGIDLDLEPPDDNTFYLKKPFTLKMLAEKVEAILLSGQT